MGQLSANKKNSSTLEFTMTVATEDYVKLSSVLRNRQLGKPTKSKHKCGAAHMHDHDSGFAELDSLPKPKVDLKFMFVDILKLEDGCYDKDAWAINSKEDKLEYIQKFHAQGNSDFKQGKYVEAITSYEKVIQIYGTLLSELYPSLEDEGSEYRALKEKETTIVLNLCQCLIQLKKDWSKVVDYCTKIIDDKFVKCENAKVFYRRAFANIELMNKEQAVLSDLEEVMKLDTSIPTKKSCAKLKEKMMKYGKERDGLLKDKLKNAFLV